MKFAMNLPLDRLDPKGEFQSGEAVREIAIAVERSGASAGYLTDHPAPSADWLHNDPTGHDALDPFAGLAFVAAATTRLKVLTSIVVLPYRNPFITAKAAATLQVLSDSRLILGLGAGYQKAEFDALGVPFAQRGALMDEALETMKLAWAGGAVVKQGRYFNAIGNEPRPVPSPPPPIWIGGGSDKAVERAARWGDGWTPYISVRTNDPIVKASAVTSTVHLAEKIGRLKELREKMGKSAHFDFAVAAPFRPKSNTPAEAERFRDAVQELASLGVNWIVMLPLRAPSRAAFLDNLAWFGQEIIAAFRAKRQDTAT